MGVDIRYILSRLLDRSPTTSEYTSPIHSNGSTGTGNSTGISVCTLRVRAAAAAIKAAELEQVRAKACDSLANGAVVHWESKLGEH